MSAVFDNILISQIGPERIDDLAHLWKALHDHHAEVTAQLGPTRTLDESWIRRKGDYATWFGEPDTFVLLAEYENSAVGYAFIRVTESKSTTWKNDDLVAKIETLSILPEFRGLGIGAKLMHEIDTHLKVKGIDEVSLTVVATNPKAIKFYENEGFSQRFLTMGKHISD